MCILNRMTGWINRIHGVNAIGRKLVWGIFLLGCAYFLIPFFSAAPYTWKLLHPACAVEKPLSHAMEPVTWTDENGVRSDFWFVPPQNGRVLVLVGGHNGTLADWQAEIDHFSAQGYGFVILPDPACNDLPASLGPKESRQVLTAASFLRSRPEVEWVGSLGFSSGAAALLMAAPQMPEMQAMALMGNFADLRSEMLSQPASILSFSWLAQRSVMLWFAVFSGYDVDQVRPVEAYASLPLLDLLLIYGEQEAERIQADFQWQTAKEGSARSVKLWIVPGAYHGEIPPDSEDRYWQVLEELFLPENKLGD